MSVIKIVPDRVLQDGGESTLARVRRFLALSMGGRSAPRCKHQNALPPDPIHSPALAVHSLLADMKSAGVGVQGVLGRPLEEVMAEHGEDSSGHGVPTLVHLLCCFLLTHGAYDVLDSPPSTFHPPPFILCTPSSTVHDAGLTFVYLDIDFLLLTVLIYNIFSFFLFAW